MKVVSLFDGISCGMVALEQAGIKVDRYCAYEIEPNAIKTSKKNYPQIEHCGDVTTADFAQYIGFDLLIGGSPCQDMSTLGTRSGLAGSKSSLFYQYARALSECKPEFFLLENNANMPTKDRDEISSILGVEPIEINSKIFVPQNRNRLYWVGRRTGTAYAQLHIKLPEAVATARLVDILEKHRHPVDLVPFVLSKLEALQKKYGKIPNMFNPYNLSEIVDIHPCLTAQGNSQTKSSSVIINDEGCFSLLSPKEWERLQGLPDNYTHGLKDGTRKRLIGNAWTVDVISFIFERIKEEANGG